MATNLKNESLYNLHMYMQYAEIVNQDIAIFKQALEEHAKNNLIGINYFEEKSKETDDLIKIHNNIIEDIQTEISSRIRKSIPDILSVRKQKILSESFDQEIENHKKLYTKKNKKTEVLKPDFTVSKEKTTQNKGK